MPPWASHHATIALTASPISWSRPGLPENPRSSPYAMLMVEFVTPSSVAPVACPLPHGDGSVPNVADEEDDAPLDAGAISTPVTVSEPSSRAAPAALMPMIRVMAEPPSAPRGFWACHPSELRTGSVCTGPYQSDIRKSCRAEYRGDVYRDRDRGRTGASLRAATAAIRRLVNDHVGARADPGL